MESSLFLVVSIIAVQLAVEKHWTPAAILSSAAYFVRPKALILSGVLLIL